MSIDLSEDPAGRASAFASGCVGTWLFVRNLVMKPAIKSCRQRCDDLERDVAWLKDQLGVKDLRIHDLEMALYDSGIPLLRKAMQGVVSETRITADLVAEKKP